jgi:SAM-dependent methyltransferase
MIDFESEWRAFRARHQHGRGPKEWGDRAKDPDWHAEDSDFAEQVLATFALEPDWTVLDVGCGTGTLALPWASRVASITALDFSPGMIEGLNQRLGRAGITNVRPVLGGWDDDWATLGIEAHDVAIASRSLNVPDLGGALMKLDAHARRLACVVLPVGDGPHDRRVFEAVGRPVPQRVDYLLAYGRLRELGIAADVRIIDRPDRARFASLDAAVGSLIWMLRGHTPQERAALEAWLSSQLVPCPEGLCFPVARIVRWAVIHWRKR